jgi:hypothetical protein
LTINNKRYIIEGKYETRPIPRSATLRIKNNGLVMGMFFENFIRRSVIETFRRFVVDNIKNSRNLFIGIVFKIGFLGNELSNAADSVLHALTLGPSPIIVYECCTSKYNLRKKMIYFLQKEKGRGIPDDSIPSKSFSECPLFVKKVLCQI